MKTKNRLLLSTALMLGLVAVSGTTATYAWFTTSLYSQATVASITASSAGSLTANYSNPKNVVITSNEGVTTITPQGKLTDVTSSNGVEFKKAAFNYDSTISKLNDVVDSTAAYASGVFYTYQFTVKLSMDIPDSSSDSYNVYLGSGQVGLEADLVKEDDAYNLKNALRIFVSDGTQKLMLMDSAEHAKYQSGIDATTPIDVGVTASTFEAVKNRHSGSDSVTLANGFIKTFNSTNKTVDLTFTIYLEGAYTTNAMLSGSLTIHPFFYAVQVLTA